MNAAYKFAGLGKREHLGMKYVGLGKRENEYPDDG